MIETHTDTIVTRIPGARRSCDVLPPDLEIAPIAGAQRGNVTREQLIACGLSRAAIARRVRNARLHIRHPGVYAVGHIAEPPLAREAPALLACGEGAVPSHQSAAALWRFAGLAVGPEVDVTLPGRQCRRRAGIHIHRAKSLHPSDIRRHLKLLVTSRARIFLDVAPSLADRELELAFDDALVRKLVSRQGVISTIDRLPRAPGRARLAELAGGSRTTTVTRSDTEERLLALIRKARLPEPEVNAKIGRHTVDFLWREARLIVEVDGYAFHSTRIAFERDRERDLVLGSARFTVMRFT